MKKLILLAISLSFILLTGCYSSRIKGVDQNGNDVTVNHVDIGSPAYYPGMILWNCGVAWPVTIAEFYACVGTLGPIALLTYDGQFIGQPGIFKNTTKFLVFEHHLPFLPASAIDYELEKQKCSAPKEERTP